MHLTRTHTHSGSLLLSLYFSLAWNLCVHQPDAASKSGSKGQPRTGWADIQAEAGRHAGTQAKTLNISIILMPCYERDPTHHILYKISVVHCNERLLTSTQLTIHTLCLYHIAFLKPLLLQVVEDTTELHGGYGASRVQYLTPLVTEARASRAGWDSKPVPREPFDTQVTYQVRPATIKKHTTFFWGATSMFHLYWSHYLSQGLSG